MWNPFARKSNDAASGATDRLVDAGPPRAVHSNMAEIEFINATAVVTFTVTDLTGQDANHRLAEFLEELINSGTVNIILDVQNVQEMDSACLGTLVKAVRALEQVGGSMALVNTDRTVEYLFKLTKLDRVFPICTDVMAALQAVERSSMKKSA